MKIGYNLDTAIGATVVLLILWYLFVRKTPTTIATPKPDNTMAAPLSAKDFDIQNGDE